ncbi:(VSG)-related, putative [Trypanosoma brucei brucei TREU927]|uniref:(VSG)-related, putative n=1 Tax=Trypanosoma brucei brucei (strain 927/4 GUTat10.1) TaxID=185431 RepID=Q38EK8_TRYB2|nr:uncharacterized protein Tb09.v1.0300 [Trypanosoma brucei brucei TREU927]EAN76762.1 (VSG)-related, putative [Trypanosoma brucei brucei TREU927]
MWKYSVRFLICLVLVIKEVSCQASPDGSVKNKEEFDTLCSFLNLTLGIRELVKQNEDEVGDNENEYNTTINTILYGDGSDGSLNWNGKDRRYNDCGYVDAVTSSEVIFAGKALAVDLLCLCKPQNGKGEMVNLCYESNIWQNGEESWSNGTQAEQHWKSVMEKCSTAIYAARPDAKTLKTMKENLSTKLKERERGTGNSETKRFGHGSPPITQSCGASDNLRDAPCVMYKLGGEETGRLNVEWLTRLEKLIEKLANPQNEARKNEGPPVSKENNPEGGKTHQQPRVSQPVVQPPEQNVEEKNKPLPAQPHPQHPQTAAESEASVTSGKNTNTNTQTTTDTDPFSSRETNTTESSRQSQKPLRPKNETQVISPLLVILLLLI